MKYVLIIIAIISILLLGGCVKQVQVQPIIPKPAEVISPPHSNVETPIIVTIVTTSSSKIAFVRNYGDYYGWDICTANSDGTDVKRITKSAGMDVHPTWSPNGTQIVFESNREWHSLPSIYTMDANGDNTKCLTPESKFCKSPSWSPDGKKIAYCIFKSVGSSQKGARIFAPDAISIMDSDGTNKQNIANGWYPTWLDGQHMVFLSNRSGIICATNIDSSDTKEYLTHLASYYLPDNYPTLSVSPNGQLVAFDSHDFTGKRDIYLISLGNTDIVKLTGNISENCYSPTWSPDGKEIAFTLESDGNTDIYIMNADGSNPTLLIKDGMFPSWSK